MEKDLLTAKSKAYRIETAIRFSNGRRTQSESVIIIDGKDEPFRVLSWQDDVPLRADVKQTCEVVMSIIGEVRTFFDDWITAVTGVVETAANRVLKPRHILLEESEPGRFTARVMFSGQSKPGRAEPRLPDASFALVHGRPSPALSSEWQAAFRGSRVDVVLRPDQVMFGPLDFPAQAAHFLDGMIRSQIDRLTPWTADNVVFGLTEPVDVAPERIGVTFAAMAKSAAEPVVQLLVG